MKLPASPPLSFLLCLLCAGLSGRPLSGQDTPQNLDFSDVEAFLKQSEKEHAGRVTGQAKTFYAQLERLLQSDRLLVDAYKDAYQAVNFGGELRETEKSKNWEQRQKGQLEDEGTAPALRLHVLYLMATLVKQAGDDERALQMTRDWAATFVKLREKIPDLSRRDPLQGIGNSVFLLANSQTFTPGRSASLKNDPAAKASLQTDFLRGISHWQTGKINDPSEVLRVNVLGFLRGKQDSRIFDDWKLVLKTEQELALQSRLTVVRETFTIHRRPWLLWQTGKDYALFRQYRPAVNCMVQAIKESPRCNDYAEIVADIRRVIEEAKNPPPAAAGAAGY
jgi:hypothetical protein